MSNMLEADCHLSVRGRCLVLDVSSIDYDDIINLIDYKCSFKIGKFYDHVLARAT
jgi:hypothetical protein